MKEERMRMLKEGMGVDMNDDEDQDMEPVDYEDVKGKLSLWVQKIEIIKWIKKIFTNFLRTYKDESGMHVYEARIHDMCTNNRQSLDITFMHLSQKYPTLAIWLAEEPSLILPLLNEVGLDITMEMYPDYYNIHPIIYIRVKDLPVEDKLRDLRQIHLNALIKIKGVVTKRTGVFPELSKMYFRCGCGDLKGPIYNNSENDARQFMGQCVSCHSNGPIILDEAQTLYRNYQKMTIQETPGTVPPGRVPRQKEVYL
jgi:DNA replication licensing factor MCM2